MAVRPPFHSIHFVGERDEREDFLIASGAFCHQRLDESRCNYVGADDAPYFEWCRPSVAHIRWDSQPVVRRIVRWAANVSCGKKDIRQLHTKAEFVPGGTIGPARKGE